MRSWFLTGPIAKLKLGENEKLVFDTASEAGVNEKWIWIDRLEASHGQLFFLR
jgi:hypothetical protein